MPADIELTGGIDVKLILSKKADALTAKRKSIDVRLSIT